jgi:hypothetical protein
MKRDNDDSSSVVARSYGTHAVSRAARTSGGWSAAAEVGEAALPFLDKATWSDEAAKTQLGNAVRKFRDGVFGGLQLVRIGSGMHGTVYRVVPR